MPSSHTTAKHNDTPLVRFDSVSRAFSGQMVVKDLSFDLQRGDILGFLGPNGAGKSTSMKMLTGNLAPTQGRITIQGVDLLAHPKQAKQALGYLPETPPVHRDSQVDNYLQFCAALHRMPKAEITAAIENTKQRCGLSQVGHRLIGNLSKGYQQRVGIAQAILHSPPIVVLDEPTVGLDPLQIREIRDLIRELGEDHAVILSTHILAEVQAICNRVQIINQGRLSYSASLNADDNNNDDVRVLVGLKNAPSDPDWSSLPELDFVDPQQSSNDDEKLWRLHFRGSSISTGTAPTEAIVALAHEQQWGLFELHTEAHDLESIFIEHTLQNENSDEVTA